MGKTTTCRHTALKKGCPSCRALQRKWYARLEESGFNDIEYGLENPRFIAHTPDPTAPGAQQAQGYYERVWQIFHAWSSTGRSRRDCRVAELYAAQNGDTGTVRGIQRVLRAENLAPWSNHPVQATLREIHFLARSQAPIESMIYVELRHTAA